MTDPHGAGPIVGVLLAAGRGQRFDASGARSKLLQPTPRGACAGVPVAVAAARALRTGVDQMIAVVAPADSEPQQHLHALLAAEACTLVVNARAADGIGTSIAAGVAATAAASGWIIALADMPFVEPATVQAVAAALRSGATTALPAYRGQRGHPVGFAATCRSALLALEGDVGARVVLARFPPRVLAVEDAGCLADLDLPGDFSTDSSAAAP